jgi:farnesyl-diphosphate farnesyltransferase
MYEDAVGRLDRTGKGRPAPRLAVDDADEVFQKQILPGVSRTFALTIPQLPRPLDRTVSNAYLLCRIADTIEDDAALTADDKEHYLVAFLEAVDGRHSPDELAHELPPLLADSTPAAERELIAECPRVLRITHSLQPDQREAMLRCVTIMSEGMAQFERNRSPHGLPDLAEMERYCYFVAGVVGEMLTELFCSHSPEIASRRLELDKYATRFGQGLQMTNILKDVWDDLERDTCWLPRDVFEASGFDLDELHPGTADPAFCAGLQKLVGVAHGSLRDALSYTLLIPRSETGIRRFLLWAIGLAVLTLRNIHQQPSFSSTTQVKVSRRGVASIVTATNAMIRSNLGLSGLYGVVARGLPVESVRPDRQSAVHQPWLSSG